jgi:hypothetical protein
MNPHTLVTGVRMADAAFAPNVPPGFAVVAGYYGGPNAFHIWSPADWKLFPGFKLPIWVGGLDGPGEGAAAVDALRRLGVPPFTEGEGTETVLDMEDRHDKTYVLHFTEVMNHAGYRVWDYGSIDAVFKDPQANGYWVADYGLTTAEANAVLSHEGTRGVQYVPDQAPGYDISLIKNWTTSFMWHG